MQKNKTKILIIAGILLFLLGSLNMWLSFIRTAQGYATGYRLTCSELIIGARCEGYVQRRGGGMCGYIISYYSAFDPSGKSELYMPFATCDPALKVSPPPAVDLVFARTIFVVLMIGGLALCLVPLFTHKRQ